MTESELLQILARSEDSRHQFKRDLANPDGVAAELAAQANSGGGAIPRCQDSCRLIGFTQTEPRGRKEPCNAALLC